VPNLEQWRQCIWLEAYGCAETYSYLKYNELNETGTAKDRNTISRGSGFLFLVSL
jgi:hypothetical protein